MWYSASEPYGVQLVFLWLSFIPAFFLVALIAASHAQSRHRTNHHVRRAQERMVCFVLACLPWMNFFARWLC